MFLKILSLVTRSCKCNVIFSKDFLKIKPLMVFSIGQTWTYMNNLVHCISTEENGVYAVGSMLIYNFNREIVC